MKKLLKYGIIATFALSGCADDFLTQEVKGTQIEDNYFNNEEECLKQIYGCYEALDFDSWWQIYNTYVLADICTDDSWMNNTGQDNSGYYDLATYQGKTDNNTILNFWRSRYQGIRRCNIVLGFVPNVTSISEEKKNRIIAEAKFLRAYQYFELARNFGGLPLILSKEIVDDAKNVKRSTLDETYSQIEKDFLEASEYLPLRSQTIASKELGRATKGAALGMLAKTYLYHEKYNDAEKYLDEVINSGEYNLLENFENVWSIDYNNSEESLFEIQNSADEAHNTGEMISVVTGSRDDLTNGWAWSGPTSDLENAFDSEGDKIRKYCTIIKNGAVSVPGEDDKSVYYRDKDDDEKLTGFLIGVKDHKCGRINAKLYIPMGKRNTSYYGEGYIGLNYRLLRYADVLLMAAEVKNQLGKDDEAQKYLNQVRSRVELDAVTSTGNELKKAIRKERRLELAMEGNRLYDIRRWTDDNGKKVACNLFGPNGSWVIYNTQISTDEYETNNLLEPQDEGINFNENRDLLFPIPNIEIERSNGVLEQNPGY
ncbi:MAG: RagB/SusD family nutrient uptake outer membrane protein [Bacteroidales bacterium]|nr:RagB/SusD family nutrient uptake outer membrane protein [Bacteroidales bacterium]